MGKHNNTKEKYITCDNCNGLCYTEIYKHKICERCKGKGRIKNPNWLVSTKGESVEDI